LVVPPKLCQAQAVSTQNLDCRSDGGMLARVICGHGRGRTRLAVADLFGLSPGTTTRWEEFAQASWSAYLNALAGTKE
jgi:hypothetical protein